MVAAAVVGSAVVGAAMAPDAPGADPNVGRAAQLNAQISQQYYDLSERQYNDQQALLEQYRPIFDEQIQLQLQGQRDSVARGNQQWQLYQDSFMPLERQMAEEAQNYASTERQSAAAREAGTDVASNFATQRDQMAAELAQAGVDPGSAKGLALKNASRIEEAKATAGAQNVARRGVRDRGTALLDNAARFGRGLPSMGLATAGLGGQQGAAALGAYGSLSQATAAPALISGQLLNGASSAATASGQLGLANFGMQMQGYNAQMAYIGDIVGAGAQGLGAYYGRRP